MDDKYTEIAGPFTARFEPIDIVPDALIDVAFKVLVNVNAPVIVGVVKVGVVIVGLVARTTFPVPVVPDVNVGLEIDGEIKVGLLFKTTEPVPVDVVVPVPPLATARVNRIQAPYTTPAGTIVLTLSSEAVEV